MSAQTIALKVSHEACTECRMCYVVCREIDLNAVYVAPESLHRFEIDPGRCLYPGCTACLMYCPAPGSIVEAASGRSLVPPPADVWTLERRVARGAA
jgi:MinD superfamily P-loop ATPase